MFETLDEEVAAEALEEIDPDIQVSIVESLDSNRAADIVEEMDPDAAADLLGDLPEDRSGEILKEMEPEERQEVTQLLEFGEHTAAGRMTTEFIAVRETAVVDDAIEALKQFEGSREARRHDLSRPAPVSSSSGAVPLVKIATSSPATQLSRLERTGDRRARRTRRRTRSRRCSTSTTCSRSPSSTNTAGSPASSPPTT